MNDERLLVKIICPKCTAEWAEANIKFGGELYSDDIKPYDSSVTLKNDEPFKCPKCGYIYTTWDIYYCISRTLNTQDKSNKSPKKNRRKKK